MPIGKDNLRLISLSTIACICLLASPAANGQLRQPTRSSPLNPATGAQSLDALPDLSSTAVEAQTRIWEDVTLAVPLQPTNHPSQQLDVKAEEESVSIFARDVDLRIVLAHLAQESHVNIVVAENVEASVTTTLNNVPIWQALDALLKINGLVWTQSDNIIFVMRPGGAAAQTQTGATPGQTLQVFDLHYTSGKEVLEVVKGLLSPSGRAFIHEVDISSTRQTRERVVVEDYPDRINTIAGYLASVDNQPRQVLIEAHVLQVTLDDDQRHGVNLAGLLRIAGSRVDVRAQGFADGEAKPGFMVGLNSHDLDGMIEALCSNSNVRTLAAPKVLVVNGQEARIQIGSKFGYFVTTTTQTSTLQSVDFLDIGVVLQVQPTITRDDQVLLTVQPKVSGGRINPDSGLPEEDTTEANTTVLLSDGQGMVIGGLIKEIDDHKKTWVPWLGEMPVIRHLFSRSNNDNQRVEVILALTPHIVPYEGAVACREMAAYGAASRTSGIITSRESVSIPGSIDLEATEFLEQSSNQEPLPQWIGPDRETIPTTSGQLITPASYTSLPRVPQ